MTDTYQDIWAPARTIASDLGPRIDQLLQLADDGEIESFRLLEPAIYRGLDALQTAVAVAQNAPLPELPATAPTDRPPSYELVPGQGSSYTVEEVR